MDKPTCESCPYWFTWAQNDKKTARGECRKNAPFMRWVKFDKEESKRMYNFAMPQTQIDFYCGEHPDFPAYLESLKPSKSFEETHCIICGIALLKGNNTRYCKPCRSLRG